jgi:hypothetical protein
MLKSMLLEWGTEWVHLVGDGDRSRALVSVVMYLAVT